MLASNPAVRSVIRPLIRGADIPQPAPDVVPLPPTPHPVQTPDTPPEIEPGHPPEVIEPSLPGEHAPVRDPIVPGDANRMPPLQ
jgi:hypothetical protein